MSVDESLSAYSTNSNSNTPLGTQNIGTDLDNHLRDIKKNIRLVAEHAQGTTPPEPFQGRIWFNTSASSSNAASLEMVFDNSNLTTLLSVNLVNGEVLPPGGPYLTGVNFNATFPLSATSTGAGASIGMIAAPLISATYTGTFLPTTIDTFGRTLEFTAFSSLAATKAQVDSGSGVYVTASSLRAAQGVAKAYCTFDGSGTASVSMSYLVDRVTRSAAGVYKVEWGSAVGGAFTGTHFLALVEHGLSIAGNTTTVGSADKTTTSYKFKLVRTSDGGAVDHDTVGVAIFHIHWANPNAALP